MHAAGIAHRDLKPSNLLVNSDCRLRIADFGMAKLAERDYSDVNENEDEHCFYMTQHVATLPYRAPELLFVMPEHSTAVDIWATGCIFAEMMLRRELFPGRSVSGQIQLVIALMGTPSIRIRKRIACERTKRFLDSFGECSGVSWRSILAGTNASLDAIDLIDRMTRLDPYERISVDEALTHAYMHSFAYPSNERTCPFKVKMDMAAIETLSHDELSDALACEVPTYI